MPKESEFYDDEDPWALFDEPSAHGEQLELPLQYSSQGVMTISSSASSNVGAYRPANGLATRSDYSALISRMEEQFQQIMDRLDSLEDAVRG